MVGGRVLRLRLDAGLTQQELADRAGISVRALQDLERGRVLRPRARSLDGLLTALGLSPPQREALMAWGGRPSSQLHQPSLADSPQIQIQVLGPLQVRDGGAPVDVGPPRVRALFALLALHVGEVVARDEIVDVLWEGEPPRTWANLVQGYVSAVRAAGRSGARSDDPSAPSTPPTPPTPSTVALVRHGYRLDLAPGAVDLTCFQERHRQADLLTAAGDDALAVQTYAAALDFWSGPVLADLGTVLREHPSAVALARARVRAVLAHADLCLSCGRAEDAVVQLERVARDEPLHEAVHARLATALAAAGERARALALLDEVRRRLADQLGIDPGPDLVRAQRSVCATGQAEEGGDAPDARGRPARSGGVARAGEAGQVIPRQLPGDIRDFVGRVEEARQLVGLLLDREPGWTGPALAVVSGTPGVGKTALAVRVAHRIVDSFPDGQLFLNLRGYDRDERVPPADALAQLLSALGVPVGALPGGIAQRSAMLRSCLAGRRVLIVLDNAATDEQVRPLLPGTAGCAVLVTSRSALPGLVARDGAQRVPLDLLPQTDAVHLLGRLIGARAETDHNAVQDLATSCARLPLALRVAAERLAADPIAPLGRTVADLADERRRLDLLDSVDDESCRIRAVLSWSYQQLPPDVARTFRLFGRLPGGYACAAEVAVLAGLFPDEAQRHLDCLARAHLVQPAPAPGQLTMHDLLRAYAAELAELHDGDQAIRTAQGRYLDHYLATAAAVVDVLDPADRRGRRAFGAPEPDAAYRLDPAQAQAWLEQHRPTTDVVIAFAASHGWPDQALGLVAVLFREILSNAPTARFTSVYEHALAAAREGGRPETVVVALAGQALTLVKSGACEEGIVRLDEALELARRTGDESAQARVLSALGIAHGRLSRDKLARECLEEAIELAVRAGDPVSEVRALSNLGVVEQVTGRFTRALFLHRRALRIAEETGDLHGQGQAWTNLASVELQLGRCAAAAQGQRRALALARAAGYRECEAIALANLGEALLRLGQTEAALVHVRESLAMGRRFGLRYAEEQALAGLGDVLRATGRPREAARVFRMALRLCEGSGNEEVASVARAGLQGLDGGGSGTAGAGVGR